MPNTHNCKKTGGLKAAYCLGRTKMEGLPVLNETGHQVNCGGINIKQVTRSVPYVEKPDTYP